MSNDTQFNIDDQLLENESFMGDDDAWGSADDDDLDDLKSPAGIADGDEEEEEGI